MHLGDPMALFKTRTDHLPATLAGMKEPLGSTDIGK